MKRKQIRYMTMAGIFCALVFVFTAYLHVPVYTGYAHIGDGFIFLVACLLPLPYSIFVGGVGACLADLLTGYAIYAPASLIIKAASVLFFSRKSTHIVSLRNMIALICAAVLCVGGYYIYEVIITGSFVSPLAGIVGNIIQSALSAAVFIVVGVIMDRLKVKENI